MPAATQEWWTAALSVTRAEIPKQNASTRLTYLFRGRAVSRQEVRHNVYIAGKA